MTGSASRLRRWGRRLLLAVALLAVLGLVAYRILLIPSVYFHLAFFIIRHEALMRDKVDWDAVRREADELRRDARTTRDTYPAIRLVLQRLGDNHSHLATPETVKAHRAGAALSLGLIGLWPESIVAVVAPDGPAAEAGLEVGDIVEAVDGQAPPHIGGVLLLAGKGAETTLRLRRSGRPESFAARLKPRVIPFNQPAAVRRLPSGYGYIDVPGLVGSGGSFDRDAIAAIQAIDTDPICGWIVDLRRNVGGNMWPMLHGVRPILGEGNPFTYRYGKGPWSQDPVYSLKEPRPAIAVLTSRLTVSSGEFLTVAFRGPATTRTFGEATGGLSTGNMTYPLPDGAVLLVTTSQATDRTGRVYDGPIVPDQPLAIDWTRLGADDDPVIGAASSWLGDQPTCRAAP